MSRQSQIKKHGKIDKIKSKIVRLLKKNKVIKAGIFGSYARGDERKDSDVDILIEVNDKRFSLLDLVKLERILRERLGKDIDLLTYDCIHPLLKEKILNEEVRII